MPRTKLSALQKLNLIRLYQESTSSERTFSKLHNIGQGSIQNWMHLYDEFGLEGLSESRFNQSYSSEFKQEVVQAYLSGEGTLRGLTRRFKLRSKTQLQSWLSKYNGNEELRSSGVATRRIPMASRKTTFEERIEIATYAIEHNRNYIETSQKFQVSYQQVRSWVLKVDSSGFESLRNGRGRKKSEDELSDNEKLRLENKQLKAELKAQRVQNDLAKKLQEILSKGR